MTLMLVVFLLMGLTTGLPHLRPSASGVEVENHLDKAPGTNVVYRPSLEVTKSLVKREADDVETFDGSPSPPSFDGEKPKPPSEGGDRNSTEGGHRGRRSGGKGCHGGRRVSKDRKRPSSEGLIRQRYDSFEDKLKDESEKKWRKGGRQERGPHCQEDSGGGSQGEGEASDERKSRPMRGRGTKPPPQSNISKDILH